MKRLALLAACLTLIQPGFGLDFDGNRKDKDLQSVFQGFMSPDRDLSKRTEVEERERVKRNAYEERFLRLGFSSEHGEFISKDELGYGPFSFKLEVDKGILDSVYGKPLKVSAFERISGEWLASIRVCSRFPVSEHSPKCNESAAFGFTVNQLLAYLESAQLTKSGKVMVVLLENEQLHKWVQELNRKYLAAQKDYSMLLQSLQSRSRGFQELSESFMYKLDVSGTQLWVYINRRGLHAVRLAFLRTDRGEMSISYDTPTEFLQKTNNLESLDRIISELWQGSTKAGPLKL